MEPREAARRLVLSYCHLKRVPRELDWVVDRLAEDMEEGGVLELSGAPVQEISEGDTTIKFFAGSAESALPGGIAEDVRAALQRCRRVAWKV